MLVAEGDEIKEDQAVLLVETEKAQVELPSPFGGRVAAVHVQAGQRVKVGAVLLSLGDAGGGARPPRRRPPAPARRRPRAAARRRRRRPGPRRPASRPPPRPRPDGSRASWAWTSARSAGPARAAGSRTTTSGPRPARAARRRRRPRRAPARGLGRPKSPAPAGPAEAARPLAGPVALPPLPRFEQWGPVEREPLRGIRRRSAEHLALAWAVIPHVTQHDQADVTELETMRRRHQKRGGEGSADLTLTVFLVKAVAIGAPGPPALQREPGSGDGRAGPQALLQHRRRGGHRAGPRGAGRAGRRREGDPRAGGRARRSSSRGRARARRRSRTSGAARSR